MHTSTPLVYGWQVDWSLWLEKDSMYSPCDRASPEMNTSSSDRKAAARKRIEELVGNVPMSQSQWTVRLS